jgi:hypothetical protein
LTHGYVALFVTAFNSVRRIGHVTDEPGVLQKKILPTWTTYWRRLEMSGDLALMGDDIGANLRSVGMDAI